MNGKLVDIKRFAVHDGPGIRTTVFLKGCTLRCIWCHNPESRRAKPELAFLAHKCVGCGDCVEACQHGVHVLTAEEHTVKREACVACGACAEACLHDALILYGKEYTPEEVAATVMEDAAFYETSNGGATVSGGEPLVQVDFCVELFKLLKAKGIHTAVDTCGNVPWASFEKILPWADMFLYDFKQADTEKHRVVTGCGNELILENLVKLSQTGKPIEIRMPLVPESNMSEDDLRAAGKFLKDLPNITAVRLLAYHSMARSKFIAVGDEDTMPHVESPTVDDLEAAAVILREYGLNVINSKK